MAILASVGGGSPNAARCRVYTAAVAILASVGGGCATQATVTPHLAATATISPETQLGGQHNVTSRPTTVAPVVHQAAGRDNISPTTTSTKESSYSVDGGTVAECILGLVGLLVAVLAYRFLGHLMDHLFARNLAAHEHRLKKNGP